MRLYSGDKSHIGTSKQELNVQLLWGYFLWNRGFQTVMPSDSFYPHTGSFSIRRSSVKTQKQDLKVTRFIPQRLLQLSSVIITWKKHVTQTKNSALLLFYVEQSERHKKTFFVVRSKFQLTKADWSQSPKNLGPFLPYFHHIPNNMSYSLNDLVSGYGRGLI